MILLILFTFADSLFASGDYFRAAGEYRREIFLEPQNPYAAMRLGDSYYKLGDYNQALFWYGKAYFLKEDEDIKERYIYLLAKTMKFEDLKILIDDDEHPLIKAVDELKAPSPLMYVSYVIPGGTQLLCGEYRTGLFSLVWNGLSLFLGYTSVKNRDIPGIIFSISLFQRFYRGNLSSAKAAIYRKRLKRYKRVVERYRPDGV